MGEKVKFILRQAAVSQTKFPSVKISCWDFSTYSKKKQNKKKATDLYSLSLKNP